MLPIGPFAQEYTAASPGRKSGFLSAVLVRGYKPRTSGGLAAKRKADLDSLRLRIELFYPLSGMGYPISAMSVAVDLISRSVISTGS